MPSTETWFPGIHWRVFSPLKLRITLKVWYYWRLKSGKLTWSRLWLIEGYDQLVHCPNVLGLWPLGTWWIWNLWFANANDLQICWPGNPHLGTSSKAWMKSNWRFGKFRHHIGHKYRWQPKRNHEQTIWISSSKLISLAEPKYLEHGLHFSRTGDNATDIDKFSDAVSFDITDGNRLGIWSRFEVNLVSPHQFGRERVISRTIFAFSSSTSFHELSVIDVDVQSISGGSIPFTIVGQQFPNSLWCQKNIPTGVTLDCFSLRKYEQEIKIKMKISSS